MAIETVDPPPTLRIVDGLADTPLERMVAATLVQRADLLHTYADPAFGIDTLVDFHARAVVTAIANLLARNGSAPVIDVQTVADELIRAGHADLGWYPALCERCPDVIRPDWFHGATASLVRIAAKRRGAIEQANGAVDAEVDEFALRDAEPAPKPMQPWLRGPQLVDAILARADDPWVDLTLGGESLVRVRVGATVVLIGGSGSGKSSLAMCLLMEHAINVGPAIALSIELPAEELGARGVGIRCDSSWEDVLRGRVLRDDMDRALNLPRLFVLDRRRATIKNLEKCIEAARAEYPGEPILGGIDYTQLLDSKEREARLRAADAMAQIDDCAREKRIAVLALSQMSRANQQKARKGEAIGAESADLGAESAAIERFATVTMAIGQSTPREDGSEAVDLSVGKSRMGKGDVVFPMSYVGKSGLWRIAGEIKKADEVRERRVTERSAKEDHTIEAALVAIAARSSAPLTKTELKGQIAGKSTRKSAAIQRLLRITPEAPTPPLVEVYRRAKGSKKNDWMVWTLERAREAGIPTLAEALNGTLLGGHE